MRCLVVLALAACGGTPKPASTESGRPPYLALLQHGQRWSLPIETVNGEHRGDAWAATSTERGALTCEVADVKTIADATMSHVQCAPPYAGLLVVGYWVATPAGLYHPALPVDDVDELTLLGENDLLLTAKPKEREHSQATAGMQHAIEAFRFKQSWCMRDAVVTEEDRRHFTLCVDGSGMTGGGELVVSGTDHSWHRSTFGVVADDPDDPTTGHDD
ncbi:MAG TPA: hypothetical protein VFV99_32475 [Kofleriaceae bacterium]|nr:hypothetical protein [Kofleriaceae bacterium]